MKDDVQDSHTPADLPPCPRSSQCLQFIDELSGGTSPLNSSQEDAQDQEILAQLREHAPTCPTCTATLASANKAIAEQRRILRAILDEGEQNVPSTTSRIMAALRQEQQAVAETPVGANNHVRPVKPVVPFPQVREIETPLPVLSKRRFRNGLVALVAVAVILIASFSFLGYLLPRQSTTSSRNNPATSTRGISTSTVAKVTPTPPVTTPGWSAVIMMYRVNGTTIIANYNSINSKSTILTTSPYAVTSVAGVSHLGDKVLYSTYDGFKTSYYLYPQSTTDAFYTTQDKNSSAAWSTDDNFIFINTSKGVAQINVQTHDVTVILPTIASTVLNNYRDGFLYFVRSSNGQAYSSEGVLYRANVTNGDIQQVTPSSCQRSANFWLSPGGVTVYYSCLDTQDTSLYSVNSDGTLPHVFRYAAGNVIGYYASSGSPLTIRNTDGRYQVVRLDLNSASNDNVLLNDVASGASTVTANDVAVAPYGYALIAKRTYSTGNATTEKLWYYDLLTSKSRQLSLPQNARSLNTIGWDRLQVP